VDPADEARRAPESPATPEVVARLVANHREFLAFLEARLPSRAAAEELLQAAFVKALEKSGTLRDTETAVAWFYRLLRNALVDHLRRSGSEARALEQEAAARRLFAEPELEAAVCRCVEGLIPNLKPQYAQILEQLELAERPLADVAAELGITLNNAAVRAHRARLALKRELERSCGTCATHGCLDCHCQPTRPCC
jgi:RNA polymerase sigma-70 factor (ECF subfamily)